MKVAITSPGSLVGARLIESLQLGDGPRVTAVAQHPAEFNTASRFAIDLKVADFFNVDSLARGFTGCRAVVHAMLHRPADMKRGTTAVCRAASQAGVRRIVFVGSADVHGVPPAPGTDERSTLHTQHAAELINALVVAERQFLADCRQLGLAGYALRAGFVYGPRAKAIATLAEALQAGRAWLLGEGRGITNGLYVDNLVAAVLLALKAKTGAGSAFLLTDAETVTWREFYLAAAHELNAPLSGVRPINGRRSELAGNLAPGGAGADPASPALPPLGSDFDARQQCAWQFPITRAARELGYRPPVTAAEGMRRSYAWWRFSQGEFSAAA